MGEWGNGSGGEPTRLALPFPHSPILPLSDDTRMDSTGTYHLLFHLPAPANIRVGALGCFSFPSGWYVYTGSAFGPGGLAARVARHRNPRRRHWHVDYLSAQAELVAAALLPDQARRECEHARAVLSLPGASVPAPRFGASDCHCPAHLAHFARRPEGLFPDSIAAPAPGIPTK